MSAIPPLKFSQEEYELARMLDVLHYKCKKCRTDIYPTADDIVTLNDKVSFCTRCIPSLPKTPPIKRDEEKKDKNPTESFSISQ